MPRRGPDAIDSQQAARRRQRIARLARSLGFRGRVEYRHAYSQTGGAQYCIGSSIDLDALIVFAEAFERDDDPADFTLRAIMAHEGGHQRLVRDGQFAALARKLPGSIYEEVLASLIGSLLVGGDDAIQLAWKATVDLSKLGLPPEQTVRTVERLRALLRKLI